MDIKIKDGDISLLKSGIPECVSGLEQAVQQVYLALKISRGSFVYNRDAGFISNFDFTESGVEKKIEAFLNESLIHSGFYVSVDSIFINSRGTVIGLTVDNGFNSSYAEVIVDG